MPDYASLIDDFEVLMDSALLGLPPNLESGKYYAIGDRKGCIIYWHSKDMSPRYSIHGYIEVGWLSKFVFRENAYSHKDAAGKLRRWLVREEVPPEINEDDL